VLGYPAWMRAYGTIPIGYPAVDQNRRYRRPLGQLLHWNGYQPHQYRLHSQVDFYESTLRPFAMYRDEESMNAWPDRDEMLGDWKESVHRQRHQSRWRRGSGSRLLETEGHRPGDQASQDLGIRQSG
jgi:hypothetical protein